MEEENSVDSSERQMKKAGKDIARKSGNLAKKGMKQLVKSIIKHLGWKAIVIGIAIVIIAWFFLNMISWFVIKDKFHNDSSKIVRDITANSEEVENIDPEDLSKLKVTCLGDSITYGLGLNEGELPYPDILKNLLGTQDVVNLGVSGSGYMDFGNEEDSFGNRINDIPEDSDIIIVFGGINDVATYKVMQEAPYGKSEYEATSNLNAGIEAVMRSIDKSKYPNAEVIIVTQLKCVKKDMYTDANQSLVHDTIVKHADYHAFSILDLYSEDLLSDSDFHPDMIHPNASGQKIIAERIVKEIKKVLTKKIETNKLVKINNQERNIEVNTEEFNKRIDEWFTDNHMSSETLGISEDYRELKKFLEAEIAILYPDLRLRDEIGTPVPEGELQGCIKFRRKFDDGSEPIYLEYMPYEEYSREIAELGILLNSQQTNDGVNVTISDRNIQNAVEQKYNYLKDKFTLDNELNVIISTINTTLTDVNYSDWAEAENRQYADGTEYSYVYNIRITKVNYQSLVEQYTMPFEMCVALLMTTESPDFCSAVADLALDSNIVFDVMDSSVTNITTKKYNYTAHYKKIRKWEYYKEWTDPPSIDPKTANTDNPKQIPGEKHRTGPHKSFASKSEDVKVEDYETITITNKTTTTKFAFNIVDTWLFDYKFEYEYKHNGLTEINNYTSPDQPYDDEDKVEVSNYHNLDMPEFPGAEHSTSVTITSESIEETKLEQIWKITEEQESSEYIQSTKEGRFAAEKFLSLVKVDPITNEFNLQDYDKNTKYIFYESINNNESEPISTITSVESFFYHLINDNDQTKSNFGEIFEYLFDLYYGRTTYDENKFSTYEPEQFISVGNLSGYNGNSGHYTGDSVREKLWWAIKDMLAEMGIENDYAVAGALGNISAESGFCSNNLENSSENKLGYKTGAYDQRFTDDVDNGIVSKQDFLQCEKYGVCDANRDGKKHEYGYGLAQWTSPGRKENLWKYTVDKGNSISDVDGQIAFLLDEIRPGSGVTFWSSSYFNKWVSYTADSNDEAAVKEAIRKATECYCNHFEVGGWAEVRYTDALAAYNDFHNAKKASSGSVQLSENESVNIVAQHTSSITGRSFITYKQGKAENGGVWPGKCNRCAEASIISGYFSGTATELYNSFEKVYREVGGSSSFGLINNVYNRFGLNIRMNESKNYTTTSDGCRNRTNLDVNKVRDQLTHGGYMQIWVSGGKKNDGSYNVAYGTSGAKWTESYHWIAILDYKKVGDKEYIYVSNSGAWGNTGEKINDVATKGYSGWYPINEFSTTKILCAEIYVDPA